MRPTWLATIVLSGCYTAPPLGAPKTPVTVLQRVFANDLSRSGFLNRAHGATTTLAVLAAEPSRASRLVPGARAILGREPARLERVAPLVSSLATRELARTPSLTKIAAVAFPSRPTNARTEILLVCRRLLGTEAFLGEISDSRHRTDPDDDRPEATLWQRLCRRLWL